MKKYKYIIIYSKVNPTKILYVLESTFYANGVINYDGYYYIDNDFKNNKLVHRDYIDRIEYDSQCEVLYISDDKDDVIRMLGIMSLDFFKLGYKSMLRKIKLNKLSKYEFR